MAQRGFGTLFRSFFNRGGRDPQQGESQQDGNRRSSDVIPNASSRLNQNPTPIPTTRPRNPQQIPATAPSRIRRREKTEPDDENSKINQRVPAAMRRIGLETDVKVPEETPSSYNLRSRHRQQNSNPQQEPAGVETSHLFPQDEHLNQPQPVDFNEPLDVEMVDTKPRNDEKEVEATKQDNKPVQIKQDNKKMDTENTPMDEREDKPQKVTPVSVAPVGAQRTKKRTLPVRHYRLRPAPSAGTTSGIAARPNLISEREVANADEDTLQHICRQIGLSFNGEPHEMRARIMQRLQQRTMVNEQTQEVDEMGNPLEKHHSSNPTLPAASNDQGVGKNLPQLHEARQNLQGNDDEQNEAKGLTTSTVDQPDEEHPGAPCGVTAKSNKPVLTLPPELMKGPTGNQQISGNVASYSKPTVSCSGIRGSSNAPMSPMPMHPYAQKSHLDVPVANRAKSTDASVPAPKESVDARGDFIGQMNIENIFKELSRGDRVISPEEYEICVNALRDKTRSNNQSLKPQLDQANRAGQDAPKSSYSKFPLTGSSRPNRGDSMIDVAIPSAMRPPHGPSSRAGTPGAASSSHFPFKFAVTNAGGAPAKDVAILQEALANKSDVLQKPLPTSGGNAARYQREGYDAPKGTIFDSNFNANNKADDGARYSSRKNTDIRKMEQNMSSDHIFTVQQEIKKAQPGRSDVEGITGRNDVATAALHEMLERQRNSSLPEKFKGAVGGPNPSNTIGQSHNTLDDIRQEEGKNRIAPEVKQPAPNRAKEIVLPTPSEIIRKFNYYGENRLLADKSSGREVQGPISRWDSATKKTADRIQDRSTPSIPPLRKAISKGKASNRSRNYEEKFRQLESFRDYSRRSSFRAKRPASIAVTTVISDLQAAANKSIKGTKRGSLPIGHQPPMSQSALRILAELKKKREESNTYGDKKRRVEPLPLPASSSKRARREGTFSGIDETNQGPEGVNQKRPRSSPFEPLPNQTALRKGTLNLSRVHGVGKRRSLSSRLSESAKKSLVADAKNRKRQKPDDENEDDASRQKFTLAKAPEDSENKKQEAVVKRLQSPSDTISRQTEPETELPPRRKAKRSLHSLETPAFGSVQQQASFNLSGFDTAKNQMSLKPLSKRNMTDPVETIEETETMKFKSPPLKADPFTTMNKGDQMDNEAQPYIQNPTSSFGAPTTLTSKPVANPEESPLFNISSKPAPSFTDGGKQISSEAGPSGNDSAPKPAGTSNNPSTKPKAVIPGVPPGSTEVNEAENGKSSATPLQEVIQSKEQPVSNVFGAGVGTATTMNTFTTSAFGNVAFTSDTPSSAPSFQLATGAAVPSSTPMFGSISAPQFSKDDPKVTTSAPNVGFPTNSAELTNEKEKFAQTFKIAGPDAAFTPNNTSTSVGAPFEQAVAPGTTKDLNPFAIKSSGVSENVASVPGIASTILPNNEKNKSFSNDISNATFLPKEAQEDLPQKEAKPAPPETSAALAASGTDQVPNITQKSGGFTFVKNDAPVDVGKKDAQPTPGLNSIATNTDADPFKLSTKSVTPFNVTNPVDPTKPTPGDSSALPFTFGTTTANEPNPSSVLTPLPTGKPEQPDPTSSSTPFDSKPSALNASGSIFGGAATPKKDSTTPSFPFIQTPASGMQSSGIFAFGSVQSNSATNAVTSSAGPFENQPFSSAFSSSAGSNMFVFGGSGATNNTASPTFSLSQGTAPQTSASGNSFPAFGSSQIGTSESNQGANANVFGQQNNQPASQDPFGGWNNTPSTTPAFGQPFGGSAPTFGAGASGPTFGSSAQPQSSSFAAAPNPFSGINNTPNAATPNFGAASVPTFNSSVALTFGNPQQAQSGSVFGFGQNNAGTGGPPGGFGNPGNAFGSGLPQSGAAGQSVFGGATFGTPNQGAGAFAMGAQPPRRKIVRGRRTLQR